MIVHAWEPLPGPLHAQVLAYLAGSGLGMHGRGREGRRIYQLPGAVSEDDLAYLHSRALAAFRESVGPGERLYALEGLRIGRWFRPWAPVGEWDIRIFPAGGTSVFLAEDYRFGLVADARARTLGVFGQPLLGAFGRRPPRLCAQAGAYP